MASDVGCDTIVKTDQKHHVAEMKILCPSSTHILRPPMFTFLFLINYFDFKNLTRVFFINRLSRKSLRFNRVFFILFCFNVTHLENDLLAGYSIVYGVCNNFLPPGLAG